MFSKLRKRNERKGKQALKFRFDAHSIVAKGDVFTKQIYSSRCLFSRGAKVSMTENQDSDRKNGSVVFAESQLTQIVTLYRDDKGMLEPKAYNIKLQAVANSTTFARGTLDVAQFAGDGSLTEFGSEKAFRVVLSGNVEFSCVVRMTWLKNAATSQSRRGSEMDMTELSFISSANLSSFGGNGSDDFAQNNPFTINDNNQRQQQQQQPHQQSFSLNQINEQDLTGFEGELLEKQEEERIEEDFAAASPSPLRKFNTSIVRSLSTTSYLSPIGECISPDLANRRAEQLTLSGGDSKRINEEALAKEKMAKELEKQNQIILESLRKEARDLRRKNDELTKEIRERDESHELEIEKFKVIIDEIRNDLKQSDTLRLAIEKESSALKFDMQTQTRKYERLESDFNVVKLENERLLEEITTKTTKKTTTTQTEGETESIMIERNENDVNKATNVNYASVIELISWEKRDKVIKTLQENLKNATAEIARERNKIDGTFLQLETKHREQNNDLLLELEKLEQEVETLKRQNMSIVQETTLLATELRKDLQKRADKEIREALEAASLARSEADLLQDEIKETNKILESHVCALVSAKCDFAIAKGEALELKLQLKKQKEKILENFARLTKMETNNEIRRLSSQ
jgi:hypothetical protein